MPRGSRPSQVYNFFRDLLNPLLTNNNKLPLIKYLQNIGLLRNEELCLSCHCSMVLMKRSVRIDHYVWYCSQCRVEKNIRKDSFFSLFPRIPIAQLMFYLWEWSHNFLSCERVERYGLTTRRSASKINYTLISICCETMIDEPIGVLGGQGRLFQCDESVFTRAKKCRNRRARAVKTQWVFGISDLSFSPCRTIFYVVENRSAAVLQPIIRKHVAADSSISTDGWAGYIGLDRFYDHSVINHRRHFVDPVTGDSTNAIENSWRWAKKYCHSKRISDEVMLHKYLQAYMWRTWKGADYPGGCYKRLLYDIKRYYPTQP